MSTIPLDIEETIIDILAEDDEYLLSVKACSLVCQAFLPLCRKHIFASIILNGRSNASVTTCKLEQFLSTKPEFADYIRKLHYNIVVEDLTNPSIQECLKRISQLQSLTVSPHVNTTRFDWSSNPLRPALLHLLHLPNLTHFKVLTVDNFLVSDLAPCINLKKFEIGGHTTGAVENTLTAPLPDRPVRLNEFVSQTGDVTIIMNICTAQRPDGQPVIDFGFLAEIAVMIDEHNGIELSQELFRRCGQLTDVNIFYPYPERVCPSLADMLRPSMHTLRHIDVHLEVNNDDVDPLFSIPTELEDMRTKNIIESITITVIVQVDRSCRQGDDWGRLDEVLTRPGWFALKRVSLSIEIYSFWTSADEMEVALWCLPETQFPRLSKSSSISFKFEVAQTPVCW